MAVTITTRSSPTDIPALHENLVAHRILAARGVRSSSELDYSLGALPSPDALPDIERAVDRLLLAREAEDQVLIVGDYDCDGATSTALMMLALRAFGFTQLDYFVPNRFDFGYGLSPAVVNIAKERQTDLIVTVDNGVASVEGVRHASQLGIDVVVTDHHLPPEQLPEPVALVNPNLEGSHFCSKNLAGVGVAFFVLLALRARLRKLDDPGAEFKLAELLDLVAIGTVADMVPLDAVNRALVEQGLRRIRHRSTRPGILALLKVAGRTPEQMTTQDIGFFIGPRLNAAGRMQDISVGIECLMGDDEHSMALAGELDSLNQQRRSVEKSMTDTASIQLEHASRDAVDVASRFGVCLYEKDWHQGIIGILAGRLKEKFHRPVVVFTADEDDLIKGSARSIPGVHIRDVLQRLLTQYEIPIVKFGGHAMAAGLTMPKEALSAFSLAFDQEIERMLNGQLPQKQWLSDGELEIADLSLQQALLLERLAPWGTAFEAPIFHGEFHLLKMNEVGTGHARLSVLPIIAGEIVDVAPLECIAFNQFDGIPESDSLLLVYSLAVNRYKNRQRMQFQVHYITSALNECATLTTDSA
ncbi:MAG: single-stranded-DNA-specific exonuclease RecJ [Gammaproteobacteria bacterium]|nr:single-stranded-DNA-specific exonuclease RecJ [Gammaproteobacteria bacterium]